MNDDLLIKRIGVTPSSQLIAHVVTFDDLVRHEVPLDHGSVEIIKDDYPAVPQRPGHVAHDRCMITAVLEVSKAGEQAEDDVEPTGAERLTHVLLDIRLGRTGLLAGARETTRRQIYAGDVKAVGCQAAGMTAAAAAKVERPRRWRWV